MNSEILAAIRQGGTVEIIDLFRLRADATQHCAALENLIASQPELCPQLQAEKKTIETIDNYMRAKLEPVCRVSGELIFAFPDQCHTYGRMGIAPGDLDVTETGQKFINPSLPGFIIWGVFETAFDRPEVMPPLTMRHFSADDTETVHHLCPTPGQ